MTALSVLTKIGLPKRLETLFIGESLFNDGIGLVFFTVLLNQALGGEPTSIIFGLKLFFWEVGGGILMGLLLAGITHYLVTSSRDLFTHTIITIAAVAGGYVTSLALHVSGPVAMVVFGLIAGSFTFETTVSRTERHDTHVFWTVIDDVLTAVLFVLIGLQLVRIPHSIDSLIAGIIVIPVALASRYISVISALNILLIEKLCSRPQLGIANLLTWGGLRGGLSIAMAFNIPQEAAAKPLILDMTFTVVTFSILVQGLTISHLFPKNKLQDMSGEEDPCP